MIFVGKSIDGRIGQDLAKEGLNVRLNHICPGCIQSVQETVIKSLGGIISRGDVTGSENIAFRDSADIRQVRHQGNLCTGVGQSHNP